MREKRLAKLSKPPTPSAEPHRDQREHFPMRRGKRRNSIDLPSTPNKRPTICEEITPVNMDRWEDETISSTLRVTLDVGPKRRMLLNNSQIKRYFLPTTYFFVTFSKGSLRMTKGGSLLNMSEF